MATKKTDAATEAAKAITRAKGAIADLAAASALEGAVTKDNVREFANLVDDLMADLREAKSQHAKLLRNQQSIESHTRRKARIARALQVLEEQEAAETAEVVDLTDDKVA